MGKSPYAVLGGAALAGVGAAVAGIAGSAAALRSPAVLRRLNKWAAHRLTDEQRADRHAAILPTPIPGPSFYSDPGDLAGRVNGEVIRQQYVRPRLPVPGASVQRFMVRSTNTAGDAVPVTATLIEPKRPWRGPGARPVVVRNQPINSLGLKAAPSYRIARGMYVDVPPLAPLLLARNYAVLIPDHEGPRMAYSAGVMAAHAVLDAVRGMHGMRADLVDAPMVMDGYSGGAIATVWAAQEQPTYAPELRFGGAVAGGTPTDYALLYRSMNGALGSGLFAAATIGQAREYPSMVELFGDFAFYMSTLVKDLPQPALAAAGVARIDLDVLAAVPAPFDSDIAQDVIAANKPGAAAPNMPILLYHGSRDRFLGDQFIPEQGVTELVGSWRSKGAMVDYLPVPGEHMIAAGWAMPRVLRWMRDVLGD
ncbi:lipase family protein [Mycobacteroides abscessus]|uniref:lipase family protein n=1 Tax=Mycobacteroides abscessus TaxID=36809 RepID=UPI000E67688A|nr:lipase family protein [Mycobacteroides abscessus]MBN7535443.1 lipase [Mycobacteroides abscessus subsp. abscessus]RIS88574.1 lipase [Mycobacteroides abscessus]